MQTQLQGKTVKADSWAVLHPFAAEDAAAMAAMRAIVEPNKGRLQGTAARALFDAIMERVAAPEDVTYEADTVGGVSGVWCKPDHARPGESILHIHGGWFNWGSAKAYRHLAGHDAADPCASPLHANLEGLPPIRVHVCDDEVLLDDSVRFVERAIAAGVDARLDVWQGMVHGFLGGVGSLAASAEALRLIGEFLVERFAAPAILR